MPNRNTTIQNKLGLHARASARLVETANQYESEVVLITDAQQHANAKSIMGLMLLAAKQGTPIELQAEGEDAESALDAVEQLINARFGEKE